MAVQLATGVGRQCLDLVKFDIVRDFFQTIGLFFANLASPAMAKAKVVWVRPSCVGNRTRIPLFTAQRLGKEGA